MMTQQIDTLNIEAWTLVDNGKRMAVDIARQALEQSREVAYKRGIVSSLTTLAMAYHEFHIDVSQSLQYALEALHLAEQLMDWEPLSKILYVMGSIHSEVGNYDEALSYMLRRLETLNLHEAGQAYIASALANIGNVYRRMGEYDKSIEVSKQALEIYRVEKNKRGELWVLNNLCFDYYKLGMFEPALTIGAEALVMAEQSPDIKVLLLTKLGVLNLEMGAVGKAERYLLEAQEEVEGSDVAYLHIRVHQRLGKLYTYQKRWQEAEVQLQTAVKLSQEGHQLYLTSESYALLSELYQAQDKWAEAFHTHKKFHDIHVTLHNEQTRKRFQALEVTYQVQTAQREARLSKKRARELEKRVAERTDDLQAANQQLLEARRLAEEANHAKSLFLANMSHELRTPLTAVLMYTEFLLEAPNMLTPEQIQLRLERIHTAAIGLEHLISDLLDISRIETGKMRLHQKRSPVHEIITRLEAVVMPLAERKQIEVIFETFPFYLYTDGNRLHQILLNLLTNAVKFTLEGFVKLTMHQEETYLCFAIYDTGIGIPPEKLEMIFQPFVQLESSHTRAYGGTGLGLAISHRLAQALGGSLTVESNVGEGSTFWLRLPIMETYEKTISTIGH